MGLKFFLFIILAMPIFCQQTVIIFYPSAGAYLYNSENSGEITENHNIYFLPGIGLSYEKINLANMDLKLQYNYQRTFKYTLYTYKAFVFDVFRPINMEIEHHNLDISLVKTLSKKWTFTYGPTFAYLNRTITVEFFDINDRLASFALGANGSIEMRIPSDSNKEDNFFVLGLLLRYTHSIFYDEGARDIDDYNQDFLTANIYLGYAFNL